MTPTPDEPRQAARRPDRAGQQERSAPARCRASRCLKTAMATLQHALARGLEIVFQLEEGETLTEPVPSRERRRGDPGVRGDRRRRRRARTADKRAASPRERRANGARAHALPEPRRGYRRC